MSTALAIVDPLLRTRIELPRLSPGLVHRPRLDKLLVNGAYCRLVVVSAPAGYGKSTLLSDWFARSQLPVAWLSLDGADNDVKRFLTSLTAAIQTAFPDAQQATRDLLQLAQMPTHEHIVAALVNDLAQFQPDFALILDDYHLIHERSVHELMSALLRRLPRNVHLVIATRVDPPWPLTRLRAQGQLVEIRAEDLGFTDQEAKAFLEGQLGIKMPSEVSATLVQQTEGWIAGLQLAAISMRNHPDPIAFAKGFKGKTNRHVRDYLTVEALSKQPRVVHNFLLRTSVLNRFCVPLCDTLMQDVTGVDGTDASAPDSQAILRRIERSNLFLIPLDEERRWYRYHHLFGELLRNKLTGQAGREEVARLHRRASAWFAANGYVEEALWHLLAAGDQDGAAELVEQNLHKDINREDWRPLEGWLKLLPAELIERRPGLLVARAWILHFQWRLGLIPTVLDRAEQLLNEAAETINEKKAQALRGNMDALWSEIFFFSREDARSMESARRALACLPESHTFALGIATGFLSFALQATGQTMAARSLLDQKLEQIGDAVNESSIGPMISVMLVLQIAGEHRELARIGSHFYKLAAQTNNRAVQSWACFLAGAAFYELNDLDQAAKFFERGIELRHFAHVLSANNCYIGLALAHQARGMSDKANEIAAAQYEFDAMLQQQAQLVADRAFQAHLHLLQSDFETAAHWADKAEHEQFQATWHLLEIPALTRATILLAEGTAASLQQAAEEAQKLWQDALGRNSQRGQAKVLALQALIYDAQGCKEQALHTLERCVALTRPGGAIRTYVDLGPRMATLLEQLRKKEIAREYLGFVLDAFPAPAKAGKSARQAPVGIDKYLVEPLTQRETEVLSLLAQHLSNKEIAQALFISELTVKSHTGAIYDKLSVKGRLAAIRRAIELGLVVPA